MSGPPPQVTSPVQGVAGTTLYEALGADGRPVPGPRVAVVAVVHGNEPVGDAVHGLLAAEVQFLAAGSVLAVRANLAAVEVNERHTSEGSDLNRLWDRATLVRLAASEESRLSYEERRVLALAPLLQECDAILDLHSTSRPADSFLVFRDDQRHAHIAAQLGVRHLVTGLFENAILSGGLCANVGLGPGERADRLGYTFEAGQHTAPGNGPRAWLVTQRLLFALGMWAHKPAPGDGHSEVFEVTERFRQAPHGAVPYRFVGYAGGEPGAGRHGALRQLHSFEEVQADEVLVRRGRNEVLRAHTPFTMLMPAPDTDPGTDLFYATQPRRGGLTGGEARSDAEARREAIAIERMLDLLADDEFARGGTWVAFDSRRLFDLCASVVGRVLRLPEGHPHRRLVVLGRGDAGGSESERRAGQRYRQAMRDAVAQGVPLERVQLLRGAPMTWLDTLTSRRMLDLTARRRLDHPNAPPIKMRVSLRQPHTTSLLVAGDLDAALRTGDSRDVRIALLVEAASVEPFGATARVRVVRAGMVSARPEVLAAAADVLSALRVEHRYIVRHGALRNEPGLRDLMLDDDSLVAAPDPERLEQLRGALVRTQLRLWCDQLRHELTEPVRLSTDLDLGRWLARTMAATGILDADALQSLAVRRDGSGWVADPSSVASTSERLRAAPAASPPLLMFGPPPSPSPPQPLHARSVVADDLERWVGWKRFVRGVQSVPDTRGKDLDLAFSGRVIRSKITRWFDEVRERGSDAPGEFMVLVAGDGLNPARDPVADTWEFVRGHRRVSVDPNLHYLRIQHAQGTHLSWMRDFLDGLAQRPEDAHSVSLLWEEEHGSTVNVVMVLQRHDDRTHEDPWSLAGWEALCCGVVLSDLGATGSSDYKVGLFTERLHGHPHCINQELLHFGRAHCEGLMSQAGTRVRSDRGVPPIAALEQGLVQQLARWIERVRVWRRTSRTAPRDLEARARWVARRLGLADARLSRALAREMGRDTDVLQTARELWRSVPAWPGEYLSAHPPTTPASPRGTTPSMPSGSTERRDRAGPV